MERKKTQATTAKLKKVQTEIKKTKDKLNKLMAEEEIGWPTMLSLHY